MKIANLAMTLERLDALEIPLMVLQNSSRFETAFCVSIEAREEAQPRVCRRNTASSVFTHSRIRSTSKRTSPWCAASSEMGGTSSSVCTRSVSLAMFFGRRVAIAAHNLTRPCAGSRQKAEEFCFTRTKKDEGLDLRRNLVKVNCAAMPVGLLESELFGHERGAFTGAINSHVGRFALADRGTLFLDEIGDMPLELQPKLLRVLQEREFEAVGSTRTTRVDVRVVAATNQDLKQMVHDGEFRGDLYYRLNAFPIYLPPLRERKADIPELVEYFVQQFAASMDKTIETIPEETMCSIVSHYWPGNIRELQNYIARGVILSNDGVFETAPLESCEPLKRETASTTLEDKIRQEILTACLQSNWKLGGPRGAAAKLGLNRTTLFYKMKRLGITPPGDHLQDSRPQRKKQFEN